MISRHQERRRVPAASPPFRAHTRRESRLLVESAFVSGSRKPARLRVTDPDEHVEGNGCAFRRILAQARGSPLDDGRCQGIDVLIRGSRLRNLPGG